MPDKLIKIKDLMESSGVKFGTSGARGLVTAMTDEVCYAYTLGFLQFLEDTQEISNNSPVAVGGDLRTSTDRIICAVCRAVSNKGYNAINLGKLPSPAVVLYGLLKKIPSIMVTGSHIPDDRNGIKYNKPTGEIIKNDESVIKDQSINIPAGIFDNSGMFIESHHLPPISKESEKNYINRYTSFFPVNCLKGKKIGLYEHSSVGRDIIYKILSLLGAQVTRIGCSDKFIPVDTEAIREEDMILAKQWSKDYSFDSIVSTDGDSDRPLISDENGVWLRGDIAGILCASYLDADAVVTPVSCNTAVEKCGQFKKVFRTRIGSPYVIEQMINTARQGYNCVIGYEANGGFLLNSTITRDGKKLQPLPTRDAVIVLISILLLSIREKKTISELKTDLPQRFTASNRLKEFTTEQSNNILSKLYSGDFKKDKKAIESVFHEISGKVNSADITDGLRMTFKNSEIIHLRPSGNAPEFRCYTEADNESRAIDMNIECFKIIKKLRN